MIEGVREICCAAFLLPVFCLAGGMSCAGGTGEADAGRIVVTQNVCRVFSTAQNRNVDRMRLSKAARESLVGRAATNAVSCGELRGLCVESVRYIGTNKVEAVFSVCTRP